MVGLGNLILVLDSISSLLFDFGLLALDMGLLLLKFILEFLFFSNLVVQLSRSSINLLSKISNVGGAFNSQIFNSILLICLLLLDLSLQGLQKSINLSKIGVWSSTLGIHLD